MTGELNQGLRRRCALLLLAAAVFRAGADAAVSAPNRAESIGMEVSLTAQETRELPPLRFEAVEMQPSAGFTAEDASLVTVGGNYAAEYDTAALLLQETAPLPHSDEPQVLIVHTHGSEAYTQEAGAEYEAISDWATLDAAHSVIRVGEEVRRVLEARGICVLHDTALNDYPVYNGAYDRMEDTISAYLERYPSITMVLDVHRDAFSEADGTAGRTAQDGYAQLMLVVGTDGGGLYHPDWSGHLGLAMQLQVMLEREAAGITRPISLRTQRFNQHLTPYSLLLEVGATGDTLPEALASAALFGEVLADLLAP